MKIFDPLPHPRTYCKYQNLQIIVTLKYLLLVYMSVLIYPQELKRWGMKNAAHRQKFLEGKDMIRTLRSDEHNYAAAGGSSTRTTRQDDEQTVDSSPPLFGSQSPPAEEAGLPSSMAVAGPPCLSHLPHPLPPVSHPPHRHPVAQLSSSQQSLPEGSQGSQFSYSSTQPFLESTFEVLQIQLRKKFNQP